MNVLTFRESDEWLWRGYEAADVRISSPVLSTSRGVVTIATWIVRGQAQGDFAKGFALRYAQV